ncbi:MAG TPA: DUF5666 domain-containing protein [Candidatus Angelobacter sp.]|nr:DUF5666 domain-containing protein [Candidatus Angelobacter sp.]
MKSILYISVLVVCSVALAFPQAETQGGSNNRPLGENRSPGEMVAGKVTSVNKDFLTVAPLNGGDPITVKIGANTRINKQRQPIKLEEIKVDDVVFVRGQINGNTVEASMVGIVSPEMAQRFQQGGMGGGRQFNREDMGKKFIAGEVKAINETKLTIARPDGQNQDIEVDENTSFKKGAESITLADIKVGDFVAGPGELKDNVFVAKELRAGRPRMMGGRQSGDRGTGSSGDQKPKQDHP